MGNIGYKSESVDIPEGSPLLEDIKKVEAMKLTGMIDKSDTNLNNGEPIYGSVCCKERERSNDDKVNKRIQLILEERHKKRNCCKCIYGRCKCKSRDRSDSSVSV